MILDKFLEFDPAGTALTNTADSTNIIDLGTARDLGSSGAVGPEANILVEVDTVAFAGATSMNVQVMGAPDNGSGVPGTFAILAESGVILEAKLVAQARLLNTPIPRVSSSGIMPRFLKLTYTIVGTHNAGTIRAGLGGVRDDFAQQATGFVGGYKAGFNPAN